MFATLLMLLLTQQPPPPPGGTLVELECMCESGSTLQEQALLELLEEFAPRSKVEEAARKADSAAEAAVASDCSEPKECKGQLHHVISKRIAKALEEHRTLRGQYEARDPRFVTRAVDEKAHCGYQKWHRDVDAEVVEWLRRYKKATSKEFETFLREIHDRPLMRERFPLGF
ncbi:MAG TPA: Wall-associated protein precursor [Archangium sp.]|uniref:Wall-associated protein precursor n=1 Tax=Archangium sp. TaxID=1872627 RepID=UPI002E329D50|nr:Wall-associated protein precursor [Archangium sp.]HEX5748722.1 Wall-associated protein precursor [Archangium sp.]